MSEAKKSWRLVQPEVRPFPLLIMDGDEVIVAMDRQAHSSKDQSVADAMSGRNFDRLQQDRVSKLNAEQLANAKVLAASQDLLRELSHLVRLLEPLERDGRLDVPGLATLNGARAAIARATQQHSSND